jgi:hypothetical protein
LTLQGAPQLLHRLEALGHVAEPLARALATETVHLAQARVPVETGRTRASIRLGSVTAKGAQIMGSAVAVILDRGARAHDIVARNATVLRFQRGGNTIFSPRVKKPRQAGTHYLARSAEDAAHSAKTAEVLIKAWNDAA